MTGKSFKEIIERNLKNMNEINIGDMVILKCFFDATFENAIETSEFGDELKEEYNMLSKVIKPRLKKIMSIGTKEEGCENGVH